MKDIKAYDVIVLYCTLLYCTACGLLRRCHCAHLEAVLYCMHCITATSLWTVSLYRCHCPGVTVQGGVTVPTHLEQVLTCALAARVHPGGTVLSPLGPPLPAVFAPPITVIGVSVAARSVSIASTVRVSVGAARSVCVAVTVRVSVGAVRCAWGGAEKGCPHCTPEEFGRVRQCLCARV